MINFNKPHIYRRQIIATGRYYIGKHKGGDKYYKGGGTDYSKDLKIYKNIKTEILEYVDDISKLNEREMYWLNKFDVVNNPLYYNLTNRSYGINTCTKEHKQKISIANTGKKRSEQVKYKMSISNTNKGIKPVIQYDKQGNIIREWKSISEAIKQTKIKGILNNVSGRSKTAGGYIFTYKNI